MIHKIINILTNRNSWMNKYNLVLKEKLEKLGYDVKCISSKNDLIKSDITFFLSCFELIDKEHLKLSKHNIVVHASDLPTGKGWSPASWQILEGKNSIPVTLFEANEFVDSGKYYLKDTFDLNGSELISEWQEKLGNKIIEMCVCFVQNESVIVGKEQIGEETFYPKRRPADSRLDVNKTIKEQFNLLRIVDNDNYPAFFEYNGCSYKIEISKLKD